MSAVSASAWEPMAMTITIITAIIIARITIAITANSGADNKKPGGKFRRAFFMGPLFHHAADRGRARAAARSRAIAQEFLDALSGIDFRRVNVALAIQADLVEPVEL